MKYFDMKNDKLRWVLSDIRFWIALFFVIRLIGIGFAPLEPGHNWRQSLTNMIARNFVEHGPRLFFPMIDMGGEKTGIIGSEFPIFNFLIYLVSMVFGYEHWYGRLINLLVSSVGIFYFHRLLNLLTNPRLAFHASLILLVSIWFGYSRKIMPDTFSVSLVIIGLYYACCYLSAGKIFHLLLFFVFSTLGILSKIPALSLWAALPIAIFIKEIPMKRKGMLYGMAFLGFATVCLWYFYWVPYLLSQYHYQLYFPKGLREGLLEIIPLIPEALRRFYFSSFYSFVAFGCFLAGIYMLRSKANIFMKAGLALTSLVFLVFAIKTGSVFPLHNYYIIPFTPVMALIAAYFTTNISPKYAYFVLLIISLEAIANQQHDFFPKKDQNYKLRLETIADNVIPKHELIVINGGDSPQHIYFSNRKGWTVTNEKLQRSEFIDSLTYLGARYLIIDKHQASWDFSNYQNLYEDADYSIYDLRRGGGEGISEW